MSFSPEPLIIWASSLSFYTYGQGGLGALLLSPQGEGSQQPNPPLLLGPREVAAEFSAPATPCSNWVRLESKEKQLENEKNLFELGICPYIKQNLRTGASVLRDNIASLIETLLLVL